MLTMSLKGAIYNKKYYTDNKVRISEKKREAYQEDLEKSRADGVAHTRASYDKGPNSGEKSTAKSKASIAIFYLAIQLYHMHNHIY